MFGILAAGALRFPGVAHFIASYGKYIATALLIVGLVVSFHFWEASVKRHAYNEGFGVAQGQARAAVDRANLVAATDQKHLDIFAQKFGDLQQQRSQAIQLTVRPQIERIAREVASNPIYRDCAVTDNVLRDLQAGRATVDTGIAASNPRHD